MKAAVLILFCACACACLLARGADLMLVWDYDINDLDQSNIEFRIYSHTNIALLSTNSPVTVIPATGTTIRVVMVPERRFWFITASNVFGESPPSNITGTPKPVALPANTKIIKP